MKNRQWWLLAVLGLTAAGMTARDEAHSAASPRNIQASLRPMLKSIRTQHNLPALAAAVVRNGKLAGVEAVGLRKIGNPVKVTPEDQFHLGSCTKAMTATLIGTLVDDGKLGWSTPLSTLLPDMADQMRPEYRLATLETLLTHRAGLPGESWPAGKSFLQIHRLPGSPTEQRKAYVEMVLRQPPVGAPGEKFVYANSGYAIAGYIAERVTKTPWEELMRQRVFRPLGMDSAGFGAMGSPKKVDQPWQHLVSDGKTLAITPGPRADNPVAIGPAGTVHASLEDWARFVIAHMAGAHGKSKLLKPETWNKLHTPLFGGDYAFGWVTAEREWGGGTVLTHAGSNNQNFAVVWMAPERDFAVLVATNQGGSEAEKACDEVATAAIQKFARE